jgi:hypothetical protein
VFYYTVRSASPVGNRPVVVTPTALREHRSMKTENPSSNESIDTDDTADTTEHERGGVAVDGAAMETIAVDEEARVVVDLIEPVGDGDDMVSVAVRSDSISGRASLDAEAAAAVADRLATVAKEADVEK